MCSIEIDNKNVYAGEKLTGRIVYNLTSPEIVYGIRVKICGKAFWGKKDIILSRKTPNRFLIAKARSLNIFHSKAKNFRFERQSSFEHETNRRYSNESEILRRQKNIIFLYEEKIYLETDFYVYGNGNDTVNLLPGTHAFQFTYRIPSHSPSSFKCEKQISCSIEYTISVERIVESMPFEDAKKEFFVLKYVDLNDYPEAMAPADIKLEKSVFFPCCCYSKPFNLNVSFPKKSITPGTDIEIDLIYDNRACISVKNIRICLRLHLIVYSEYEKKRIIYVRNIQIAKKYFAGIKSKETKNLKCEFPIPSIQPWNTDNSDLFQINYSLEFKVKFQRFYRSLVAKVPVIFGNGPKADDVGKSSTEILNVQRNELIVLNDIDDANEKILAKIQRDINNE